MDGRGGQRFVMASVHRLWRRKDVIAGALPETAEAQGVWLSRTWSIESFRSFYDIDSNDFLCIYSCQCYDVVCSGPSRIFVTATIDNCTRDFKLVAKLRDSPQKRVRMFYLGFECRVVVIIIVVIIFRN